MTDLLSMDEERRMWQYLEEPINLDPALYWRSEYKRLVRICYALGIQAIVALGVVAWLACVIADLRAVAR